MQYLARDLLDAGGGLRMRGHMLEHLLARNPADRPSSFEAVVNPAFLNDEEKEDLLCMASTGAARNDRVRSLSACPEFLCLTRLLSNQLQAVPACMDMGLGCVASITLSLGIHGMDPLSLQRLVCSSKP